MIRADRCAGNTQVINQLHQAMSEGAITFEKFMQISLYGEGGYYVNSKTKIGAKGDFITAPEISPFFGQALAKQILEIAQNLNQPISIVELGPGLGTLAKDIIQHLEQYNIEIEKYILIETSPSLTETQKNTLAEYNFCEWHPTLESITKFCGVIIANELLDALPVHKVQLNATHSEWYVKPCENGFKLSLGPISNAALQHRIDTTLQSLETKLPFPYDTEFNLAQETIIHQCYKKLQQGVMLFIDYGFGENEFYNPSRFMGTLMAHHKHTSNCAPLANPGEQDITAHVDFTSLTRYATDIGLALLGFSPQAQFLIALDILTIYSCTLKQSQAIQTLLSPQEMGELFKVIAFGKHYEKELKGFSLKDYSYLL